MVTQINFDILIAFSLNYDRIESEVIFNGETICIT